MGLLKTNKKVIGIALAVAIVAAAVGVFFLLGPSLSPGTELDTRDPVAVLTILGIEGLTVSVSAEGSIAPRGEHVWNFGDGHPQVKVTTLTTTHTYAEPGAYIIMLEVFATGGIFTQLSRVRQLVEIGGTGFGPSITLEQSFVTSAPNVVVDPPGAYKLLFTEVPQDPQDPQDTMSQDVIALELYDANGVLLFDKGIRGLLPSLQGDVTYVRALRHSISVGDYILVSTSVYPAGTTYKLREMVINWVLAEGTLDTPFPFLVSVALAWGGPGFGNVWVINFTSVPSGLPATQVSIDIYQPNGIQLLAPTPITVLRGASLGNYFPVGDSLNVAVGDIIHLAEMQYPELSSFRLLDTEASKVLVSDSFGAGILPIGISITQTPDGLNWMIILADVPADMAASSVFLSVLAFDGSALTPQRVALSDMIGGETFSYVPIVPSSSVLNAGDRILLLTSAYPAGTTFLLTDLSGIILARGMLN